VEREDGLLDQGTVDIINISSLAGYKVHPKFALSGLGELNTSLGKFLEPGTADIGIGGTWLPIKGMTVVIHPRSTTFTTYQPYSNPEGSITLREYTWLNTLAFEVWRGIGVGVNFGFRQADFETINESSTEEGVVQKFYQVGLNYGF